jgi:nucleoside-diphosphate-sugar epimerase
MAKTVLVTGGRVSLVRMWRTDSWLRADVTILDDLSSGRVENLPAEARFVRGDITTPDAQRSCGWKVRRHVPSRGADRCPAQCARSRVRRDAQYSRYAQSHGRGTPASIRRA